MSDLDLGIKLFLQIAIILLACRFVGWIGRRLGQSQVVCEMLTGVLLGPSLLGALAPGAEDFLFPHTFHGIRHPSMQILYVLSQVGLVLYMFLIGNEFDPGLLRSQVRGALAVSISGIALPFACGAGLAFLIHQNGSFFDPSIAPWEGALYMGASMCITAFPMLARILFENGLSRTRMGTLALASGASDDAFSWCLLAIVIAAHTHVPSVAILGIGGGLLFGALMMTVGRRAFVLLERWAERERDITPPVFVTTMALLFLGAWFTDAIHIYAVFGAFIVGAAMPKGHFADKLREKLEATTVCVFLPLFFVYSGLNTKIGLVNTPYLIGIASLVIFLAIFGKGVGCALAAKLCGEPWREAWTIGTLMNARGLMELIILNIGLQQKVITPTLFTIMVLMAVVTTLMASPIYQWLYGSVSHPVGTAAVGSWAAPETASEAALT